MQQRQQLRTRQGNLCLHLPRLSRRQVITQAYLSTTAAHPQRQAALHRSRCRVSAIQITHNLLPSTTRRPINLAKTSTICDCRYVQSSLFWFSLRFWVDDVTLIVRTILLVRWTCYRSAVSFLATASSFRRKTCLQKWNNATATQGTACVISHWTVYIQIASCALLFATNVTSGVVLQHLPLHGERNAQLGQLAQQESSTAWHTHPSLQRPVGTLQLNLCELLVVM